MVYKWYILPIGGLYATYHILIREPETTIDFSPFSKLPPENTFASAFQDARVLCAAFAEVAAEVGGGEETESKKPTQNRGDRKTKVGKTYLPASSK